MREGIDESNIHVVGNTGLDNITTENCTYDHKILVTLHRRNNLHIMDKWFSAIEMIALQNPKIEFILPIHPNPEVQRYKHILKQVKIVEPMTHEDTINVIKMCKFIISDSGGIQEEASYLNKKIIICRIDTERPEVLEHHGVLCKTPEELSYIFDIINNDYIVNESCRCPFGDGTAHTKITRILENI